MKTAKGVSNSIIYSDKILTCDSCGKQYGFLTEIKSTGRFCDSCFRSAFEQYFEKHPKADYVLIRGVAYNRSKEHV